MALIGRAQGTFFFVHSVADIETLVDKKHFDVNMIILWKDSCPKLAGLSSLLAGHDCIEIASKHVWYWVKHTFYRSCFALYVLNAICILSALVIFFPTFYGESYELRFAIRTFPVIVQSTIISQHMVPFS